MNHKLQRKTRRKTRVSANITGTAERPRVSIFRSNKYIYAQVIDDGAEKTLAACSSLKLDVKGTKSEKAHEVGKKLAEMLKKINITTVVFDRGAFLYSGRVKNLAEGLRAGEIKV